MKKVGNKLFAYFSTLIMILGFFLPNFNYVVKATEGDLSDATEVSFTNVEDGVLYLDMDENNSKDISVSTEGYILDTCAGGSLVSVSFENGICSVKALEYGKSYVTLSYVVDGEMVPREVTYPVSIEYEEYFNFILNELPKEFEISHDFSQDGLHETIDKLLPSSFSVYFDDDRNLNEYGTNICSNYVSEPTECYGFLVYSYNLNANDVETKSVEFVVNVKDDIPDNDYYDPHFNNISDQYISVGETKDLELFGENWGDSNKYFWVSEDNNIAKINTRNQLVGVSKGKTTIRLVDKETFDYISFDVTVESNLTKRPIVEFLSMFEGTLEVDISNIEYFDPTSAFSVMSYFNNMASSVEGVYNLSAYNISCADGLNNCVIDYGYNDSSWNYIQDQTASFNIVYKGLNAKTLDNSYNSINNKKYVYLNKENYFILYNFESTDPVVQYDDEFIQLVEGEDGIYSFIPIKEGSTTVDFYVGDYVSSVKLEILFEEEDITQFQQFYDNLSDINVPFTKEDASLNLINSFLEAYIKDNNEDNSFVNHIKIDSVLVNDKDIELSLRVEYNGLILFEWLFDTKFVNLHYNSVIDETTYKELEKLRENIKDEYIAPLNGSIFLANEYSGDDFYNALINQVHLMHDANSSNGLFQVQVIYRGSYKYNNYLLGGVYYDIYIYKDDVLVGVDRTYINTNFLIDRSVFDNDNQVAATDYISGVIKDITNEEYEVVNIKDNYYRVNGKNAFNVIYDHKELIEAEEAQVYLGVDRIVSLDVEEEYQLEVLYNPFTATYADIAFYSSNTDVFTVDSKGKITAVGKGHAILSFSDGNMLNYYLVAVGYDGSEFIDELLGAFDLSHFDIEYSELDIWDNETDLLSNYIRRMLEEKYDLNYMGIYSFDVDVTKDNDSYKFTACIFGICSAEREFTLKYVGIDSTTEEIILNVGENKTIDVVYTEGDISDLRYTVIDSDVATVDKNGKVTASSSGRTYLKIYDKKHKYVRHIPIVVDIEEHINNMIDAVKNKTYDIEFVPGDDDYSDRSIGYAVDTEMYLDGYDFNRAIYGDEYSNQYDISVDRENNQITYVYYLDNEEYEVTTKFNFVGFAIEDGTYEVGINDTIFVSYATFDGGEPNVKSLTTDICTIYKDEHDNSWIKGVSTGFCGVEFSYKGYKKIVDVLVDSENLSNVVFDDIDVPSEITLKLDQYDITRKADPDYNNIYDAAVRNYFSKYIGDSEYLEFDVSNVGVSKNGDEVTISFIYDNNDIGYGVRFRDDEYLVKINYSGHTEGWEDIRDNLEKTLKKDYVLTNDQMMGYMLADETDRDLYLYSSFVDDVESVCDDCKIVQFAWGSADGELGIITQGFDYVIFKDDEPLYNGYVNLTGSFIMDVVDIDDHGKFEKKLKQRIHDAYKKHKDKYRLIKVSSILRGESEEEFEYPIELTYVDSNGNALAYQVSIDGRTFNAIVSLNFVEGEEEPVKVEEIKLNAEILNLTVGDTFDLVATISPLDAANKALKWISSNSNVVTVVDGKVTAVGSGNAVITVESVDGGASTSINVSVIANGLAGDIDNDGKVNIVDLVKLRKHLAKIDELTGDALKRADFNKDGSVNIKDLVNMRQHLAK